MDASVVAGHRKRSANHAKSADDLASLGGVREWEIVMRFYSALRLVDAFFAIKEVPADSHPTRWLAIKANRELSEGRGQQFKMAYKRLREVSEDVRYGASFSAGQQHIESCRADLTRVLGFLNPKIEAALKTATAAPHKA